MNSPFEPENISIFRRFLINKKEGILGRTLDLVVGQDDTMMLF